MKVTITYYDNDSLTIEEVVARAKHTYGDFVEVSVQPTSNKPSDMLYFALQQMLTHEQLSIFFDDKNQYPARLSNLRSETLAIVQQELSAVIKDNEIKVT
jgi:hypothetical protein